MTSTGRPVGVLAMLAAIVSFALSTPIVKWAGEPGVVIAFWRMWFALGLWWIVVLALRRPFPDRRTWRLVAPAGLCFGLNISTLFTAVTRTSIAHLEFITTLTPLVAVPASAWLFGERPDFRALRWAPISLVGVSFVLFFGPSTGTASLSGDLLVLLVIAIWTTYLMFTKRARAHGIDTVTFMACMVPTGLLTTVPVALVTNGDQIGAMEARGWMVALVLAVLTGMVAHGCIAFAQQHLPIQTITVMQVAQPALATFFAFLILGEEVRPPQIFGMALVITGITLFTMASQRALTTPPAGLSVRDAAERDLDTITDIFNQAIPDGNAEWTEELHSVEERRDWWTGRVATGRPVIVAVDPDDRVVGVASYGDFRDSTCREGFRFTAEHSVYLDADAKGSGAADLLMDELEQRARAAGLRMMLATIDGANPASIRFHERRGYVETGRLPSVGYTFGQWRDFVIMQLDLDPDRDDSPGDVAATTG